MTINITNSGYLAQAVENRPVVGWQSLVAFNGFSSDDSIFSSSANNMWSPDTYTFWRTTGFIAGTNKIVNLDVSAGSAINYFAVYGQKFGEFGPTVSLEVSDDGTSWSTATGSAVTTNENVAISYFDDVSSSFFRLRFAPNSYDNSDFFTINHVRVGEALVLERPYFVGNSPNNKQVEKVVNQSDNGRYLGSTLVSVTRPYSIPQQNNTDPFVRQYIDDFLDHCELVLEGQAGPLGSFFYACRPEEFPEDTYYCHAPTNVSRPEYQRPNKMMQWSISGVAER